MLQKFVNFISEWAWFHVLIFQLIYTQMPGGGTRTRIFSALPMLTHYSAVSNRLFELLVCNQVTNTKNHQILKLDEFWKVENKGIEPSPPFLTEHLSRMPRQTNIRLFSIRRATLTRVGIEPIAPLAIRPSRKGFQPRLWWVRTQHLLSIYCLLWVDTTKCSL